MEYAHPTLDPEYWRTLARHERAFAAEDRKRRGATYESIRIHEQNAAGYERHAERLEQSALAACGVTK